MGKAARNRATHLDEKLSDVTHGLPDLSGPVVEAMQRGRELGQQARAAMATPIAMEVPEEFTGMLTALADQLNSHYPGNDIELTADIEAYVGCTIVHWKALANGHHWHVEEVTTIGGEDRPEKTDPTWSEPYVEMMRFIEWALLIDG